MDRQKRAPHYVLVLCTLCKCHVGALANWNVNAYEFIHNIIILRTAQHETCEIRSRINETAISGLKFHIEFSVVHISSYKISFLKPSRFPVHSLSKALHIFRSTCIFVRERGTSVSLPECINIETQPSNLSLHSFLSHFLFSLSFTRFCETFPLVQQPPLHSPLSSPVSHPN